MGFDLGAFAGGIGQGIEQGQDIAKKQRERAAEARLMKTNAAAAMVQAQRATDALKPPGSFGAGGAAPQLKPGGAGPAPGAPQPPQPGAPPPQQPPMGGPPKPPQQVPMPGATPMSGAGPQPPRPGMMAPPPGQGGGGMPGANRPPPPQGAPPMGGPAPQPKPPRPPQGAPPPQGPPPGPGGQGAPPGGGAPPIPTTGPFAGIDMQQVGQQYQQLVKIGQQHFTSVMQEVMQDAQRTGKKLSPLEAMDAAHKLVEDEDLDPTLKSIMTADINNNKAQLQFVLGGQKIAGSEQNADTRAGAQEDVANINADARRYGADQGLAGRRAGADATVKAAGIRGAAEEATGAGHDTARVTTQGMGDTSREGVAAGHDATSARNTDSRSAAQRDAAAIRNPKGADALFKRNAISQAREAIAKGAPKAAVMARLKALGVPTDGF